MQSKISQARLRRCKDASRLMFIIHIFGLNSLNKYAEILLVDHTLQVLREPHTATNKKCDEDKNTEPV